jgi:hypothetical protein
MLRRRLRVTTAAAAIAIPLSLLLLGPATTATASGGSIVIDEVSSPPADVGLLSVTAEATSPITSLAVHLYLGSTDELDLTSSDLALSSGGPTAGTWTVTTPITTGELPVGTYQTTVDASDQGGDSISGLSAGSFAFVVEPTVTMTPSTTTLSYTQPSVTLTGSVTGRYPDGSSQPLTGQRVTISGYSGTWGATTNASGDYSVTITPNLQTFGPPLREIISAQVPQTSTLAAGGTPALTLTGQAANVQIRVRLSSPTVNYGQRATLSGTAQYQPGGVWKPLAGATIDVAGVDYYNQDPTPTVTAVTDAHGNFSAELPTEPSTTWTAQVQASQYLIQGYSANPTPESAFLTVRLPTVITRLRAHFNPIGQITASGCLGLGHLKGSPADIDPPEARAFELQYSRTATGPWRDLGAMTRPGSACRASTAAGGLFGSAVLSGYYRLTYAGGVSYEPSVSSVTHAATVRTKFADFNVTPRAVSGHGRITVSGQLKQQAKGWRALGPEPIKILIQPHGTTKWYWYKKLRTSASGRFSVSFADPITAHWAVLYGGDNGHLESASSIIYVYASGTGSALGHALRPGQIHRFLPGVVRVPLPFTRYRR